MYAIVSHGIALSRPRVSVGASRLAHPQRSWQMRQPARTSFVRSASKLQTKCQAKGFGGGNDTGKICLRSALYAESRNKSRNNTIYLCKPFCLLM
eukprot:1180707-Prorocentrum_minimum.AAC.5